MTELLATAELSASAAPLGPPLPEAAALPLLSSRDECLLWIGRWAIERPPLTVFLRRVAELIAATLGAEACAAGVAAAEAGGQAGLWSTRRADDSWAAWEPLAAAGDLAPLLNQAARLPLAERGPALVEELARLGLEANRLLAAPLGDIEHVLGLLAVTARRGKSFTPADARLLESAAGLVASVAERERLAQRLKSAEEVAEAVLSGPAMLLVVLDEAGHFVRLNERAEQTSGFTHAQLGTRTFVGAFSPASEAQVVSQHLRQVAVGQPPVQFQARMLTRDGVQKHVRWSFLAVALPEGGVQRLGTGVEITEVVEARERAQRAENAARHARNSLVTLKASVERGDLTQIKRIVEDALAQHGDTVVPPVTPEIAEKRAHRRAAFEHRQRVGPIVAGQLPPQLRMLDVECQNLSAGGISFWLPEPPVAEEYLVELGKPPHTKHLRATVKYWRRARHQGREQVLVGCAFCERV